MKVLTIAISLVAIASARPEVSHLITSGYLPAKEHTDHNKNYLNTYLPAKEHPDDNKNHLNTIDNYPQIHKHVYFYADPYEEKYTKLRIVVAPKAKKNTKIIFIKAPSYGGVVPEIISTPSLSEDKTFVYVLVKKPQTDQSVTIPVDLGVKHHKPGVFFIKYKNKHDAENQINAGVQEGKVGVNVPNLSNQNEFINTLDSGTHQSDGVGGDHKTGGYGSTGSGGISTQVEIDDDDNEGNGKHGPPDKSGPY
ncbi:hypothetical protein FQA39_LY00966 [Lamprigera yunnana]|nr:hypothetical protein FQA39_LY00966 [Lamprigera yunnana]